VTWYRKAADQGDAKAQYNLGFMYDNGQGVPQNDAEAMKWYRKAADQGDAEAQFNLGLMYDNGQGVPQNYAEAMKWYRLAADQGDADAQYALAKSYRDGRGIPRDDLQAYWWFSQVAASDDASHKNDAVKELYLIAQKFPAGTNLDPPLPPEPFGLKVGRWMVWPMRALGGWIILAIIWGFGTLLIEKLRDRRKTPASQHDAMN
jgi:hypothetical protein